MHAHGPEPGGSAPLPGPVHVKPQRLLATLGVAGALAGSVLVVVYGVTLPTIEANKQRELEAAISVVLKSPQRYETLYVVNGSLTTKVPDGTDPKKLERVYLGYGTSDQPLGFALVAGEPGFQDIVRLIFGYDPGTKQVLGMAVLESKETPGLGDKIEKDETFARQFDGVRAPLVAVKKGKRSKPGEVETITGATISSKAVIRIINGALERLGPLVDAYTPEGRG